MTGEMDKSTFQKWFVEILEELSRMRAGFPIMLIALPILERYLREVSGNAEDNLDDDFYRSLIEILPEVRSIDQAKLFWHTYRNGLLHQLTFSLRDRKGKAMPPACITFDQEVAIVVLDQGQFSVNPILFSQRVTAEILDNYEQMAGNQSPNHPKPFVFNPTTNSSFTGTASDDSWKQ